MKRITILLALAALSLAAFHATAQTEKKHEGHGTGESMTMAAAKKSITGEVVDTGCYLGHAARGAKHVSCATKCINQGMPMGLLTSSGTLYLLTMNHDNADPYNEIKGSVGKTVTVTGMAMTRGGMKGIDVSQFTAAAQPGK